RDKSAVKTLISERHWRDGLSIRAIERELGIATSVLNAWCKRHGIVVRSKAEQITACNAADEAGTCDSRLPEVGIVLKEECRQRLGKCCV
ncbi:MAG: hypothetical protein AAB393_11455, partial [Bacteroidota bacterium]